jgi:hypothetical protein
MKRILALILFVVAAAVLATAGSATQAKSRSGQLHITKACPQYDGTAGSFCTITSSNIEEIKAGMRVTYLQRVRDGKADSVILLSGNGRTAFGHVLLDLATVTGQVTFSNGTGKFTGFHAKVAVSRDASGVVHWDGTYKFRSNDDDD